MWSWDYPADHNHGSDVHCDYCGHLLPGENVALYDDDTGRWFCGRSCLAKYLQQNKEDANASI